MLCTGAMNKAQRDDRRTTGQPRNITISANSQGIRGRGEGECLTLSVPLLMHPNSHFEINTIPHPSYNYRVTHLLADLG